MTINGFSGYQSKYCSQVKTNLPVNVLVGKRVAVDLYLLVFQSRAVALKEIVTPKLVMSGTEFFPLVQEATKKRFFQRMLKLYTYGWYPIFCVDADFAHPLRARVRERRGEKNESLGKKITIAQNQLQNCDPLLQMQAVDEYVKYVQQKVYDGVFPLVIQFRNILRSLGFPVVSPEDIFVGQNFSSDGEAVAAALTRHNLADIAYTNDTDCHSYGAYNCVLEVSDQSKTCVIRNLNDMLNIMQVDFFGFQLVTILAGTDFNDNIPQFAFGKALKLVRETKYHPLQILALQVYQLMTWYGNQGGNVQEKVPREWACSSLRISEQEMTTVEQSFAINFTMPVCQIYQILHPALVSNPLLQKLCHPNINFFAVYPIFRSTEIINPDLRVDFDTEKFAKNARAVFRNEGIEPLLVNFISDIPALQGIKLQEPEKSNGSETRNTEEKEI